MREAFGPPHNPAELVEEYIQSAFNAEMLLAELTDMRSTFFVFEAVAGTAIGYAKLRQHAPPRQMAAPDRQPGNAIEIQCIYLLETHTGQGQGQRLMQHCLDWASIQHYKVVWLGVWERNERALAFYEKMGFERFGYHYFQFGSERQRDYWLQKKIAI